MWVRYPGDKVISQGIETSHTAPSWLSVILQDLSINSCTVVDVFENFPPISPGNNPSSQVYKEVQDNSPLPEGKPRYLVIGIHKHEKRIWNFSYFEFWTYLSWPFSFIHVQSLYDRQHDIFKTLINTLIHLHGSRIGVRAPIHKLLGLQVTLLRLCTGQHIHSWKPEETTCKTWAWMEAYLYKESYFISIRHRW
jgi:hypothetical protein